MTTASSGRVGHLWSWAQAVVLVYLSAFAMVILGAIVTLPVRGASALLAWAAASMR